MCNPPRYMPYAGHHRSTQHVVLLDWDDTLMPTTYLLSHIAYKVNRNTKKVMAFRFKSGSNGKENEIRQRLQESGSAALRMLRTLYLHFLNRASGRNLLIVTNGAPEWLWNSLTITGALCPIYRQIEQLLRGQRTQIVYARNRRLEPNYWKMAKFDLILERFIEQKRCQNVNVITIGDQWTDHCSIALAPIFQRHPKAISHHQIKLYPAADAHYMATELNYIAAIFSSETDQCPLLKFADDYDDGVIIEFDGYHDDKECEVQSECGSTDTTQ